MFLKKTLLTVGLSAACAFSRGADELNLWWERDMQCANIGQTVTIDVYANSTGPNPLALSDAYLAITWDPAVLTNATPSVIIEDAPWEISYWAPGSPANTDLQDGDARRELLGLLPPDFPVAPVGIMRDPNNRVKVTTFTFTVDVFAATTSVKLWGSAPNATTNFYKGDFQIGQWPLMFESGDYSEAMITPIVPFGPSGYNVTEGYEYAGDLASLFASDDNRIAMLNDEVTLGTTIEFYATSVCLDPSAITVEVETHVLRYGISLSLAFYDYTNNMFVVEGGGIAPITDTMMTETESVNAPNYVNQTSGEVRARLHWEPINDEDPAQDSWPHEVDFLRWTMTP